MRADKGEVFAGNMLQILADSKFGAANIGDQCTFFYGWCNLFEQGGDACNGGAANDEIAVGNCCFSFAKSGVAPGLGKACIATLGSARSNHQALAQFAILGFHSQ